MGKYMADDDVRRVNLIYLGPPGNTFPFHVRYVAYAAGLVMYFLWLGVAFLLPLPIILTLFYPLIAAILSTYGLMSQINHDRNVRNVLDTWQAEFRTRKRFRKATHDLDVETVSFNTRSVRVRTTTPGEHR